jgi:hypothetical protein
VKAGAGVAVPEAAAVVTAAWVEEIVVVTDCGGAADVAGAAADCGVVVVQPEKQANAMRNTQTIPVMANP